MLLRSICCYVQDVVITTSSTCWRCCYVEDVVMLKMLLCWRCYYKCFQNGFVDVKRKKAHVHFAHGSLVDYDIFMSIKRNLKFPKTRNSNVKSKNDLSWWTWKRPNNIETGGQHIPDMLSACGTNSWYSHVIGRTPKHCKTQWTMTFFKLEHNELHLPSEEPPASALGLDLYEFCIRFSMIFLDFLAKISMFANVGGVTTPCCGASKWERSSACSGGDFVF